MDAPAVQRHKALAEAIAAARERELAVMADNAAALKEARAESVVLWRKAKEAGWSWEDIAAVVGVTRAAIRKVIAAVED